MTMCIVIYLVKLFYDYRAKHPVKLHVWAGISLKGRMGICIFEGRMNAELYVRILEQTLLPFIEDFFPDGFCRFMQDNDPKHTSRLAQNFFEEKGINWWMTPPESPDCKDILIIANLTKIMTPSQDTASLD